MKRRALRPPSLVATTKGESKNLEVIFSKVIRRLTGIWVGVIVLFFMVEFATMVFRSHSLDLQTITVPNVLTEIGLNSDVATRHLRDAVEDVHNVAHTSSTKNSVELTEEMLNVTIPKTGISLENLAAGIRRQLPGTWHHDVTGEITKSGSIFTFRLRINGKVVFNEEYGGSDSFSVLIAHGAFKLIEETEPYIAASWLYGDGHGDLESAEQTADRVIALFPDDAEKTARAYNLKGLILKRKGKIEFAVAMFKRAANDLPIAWSNLGDIYYEQGRLDEAISAYRRNIRYDSHDPYPYHRLGDVFDDQGNVGGALEKYNMAIKLDSLSLGARRGLGNIFMEEGKIKEAMAEYRIALSISQKDAGTHNGIGNVLRALGKVEDASKEYHQSVFLNQNYAKPHNGLGNLLSDQGDFEKAISEYRKAISIDPRYAPAHDGLGMALRINGSNAESLVEYFTATKLDPRRAGP